jgi:hypothetical protein
MIPFHQRKFEGTSVLRIFMMAKNEWDGMEWNGLAWIGLDWNGMEMKWTGKEMEWSGMEWNDMA